MVILVLIGIAILGFFFLSIFDRELRDKAISRLTGILSTVLKKTPVIADTIIVDPLTEQIRKFTAGRNTGGAKVDAIPTEIGVG